MCRHFDTGLVDTLQHLKTKYVKYSWFATTWHTGHVVGQYHENGVKLAADRNAFVLDHHHGCHDVTCKAAIYVSTGQKLINNVFVTLVYQNDVILSRTCWASSVEHNIYKILRFWWVGIKQHTAVRQLIKKIIKLKLFNRPFTSSKNSCL